MKIILKDHQSNQVPIEVTLKVLFDQKDGWEDQLYFSIQDDLRFILVKLILSCPRLALSSFILFKLVEENFPQVFEGVPIVKRESAGRIIVRKLLEKGSNKIFKKVYQEL